MKGKFPEKTTSNKVEDELAYSKEIISDIEQEPQIAEVPTVKERGTIELVPYSPTNPESTVERHHSFSDYEEINLHQGRVWEMDKLCLHKEYHHQGYFVHIIQVLYNHALEHNPKYYIGLMEKKFFRMARIFLGVHFVQRSEALVFDESTLIPVVLDIESIIRDEGKLAELFSLKFILQIQRKVPYEQVSDSIVYIFFIFTFILPLKIPRNPKSKVSRFLH